MNAKMIRVRMAAVVLIGIWIMNVVALKAGKVKTASEISTNAEGLPEPIWVVRMELHVLIKEGPTSKNF